MSEKISAAERGAVFTRREVVEEAWCEVESEVAEGEHRRAVERGIGSLQKAVQVVPIRRLERSADHVRVSPAGTLKYASLQNVGMRVTLIRDVTPIPHNGCRPPKRRRV